jgi:tetratricopeptide (TPR) repeat protein
MGDRAAATRFYEQADRVRKDGSDPLNAKRSYELFSAACYADPTWWLTWYQHGNNHNDIKLNHAAVACWRRALQCEIENPIDRAKVLSNFGWGLSQIGEIDAAYSVLTEATKLAPKHAAAWTNLSTIQGQLGSPSAAVGSARIGKNLDPENLAGQMSLSFALLFNRQFVEGFKEFECRYAYALHNFLHYPYPKWLGEPGKTVFLVADQGLGDTLSFARFVPVAASVAKYLHLYVQPELVRLFQHAFMFLKNVNIIPYQVQCPYPEADAWTTFVSLPFALKLTDEQIRIAPPIPADAGQAGLPRVSGASWKVPDQKLHVGIAWAGSELNLINKHRSIPLTHFFELARVKGVQLYSLQIDQAKIKEMNDLGGGAFIRDLSSYVRDVADSMSLIRNLDLVITCESALGHICSTIGKECWVPYSYLGRDYRAGHNPTDAADRLWTPNHRFFSQSKSQKWEPVFERIEQELAKRVRAL